MSDSFVAAVGGGGNLVQRFFRVQNVQRYDWSSLHHVILWHSTFFKVQYKKVQYVHVRASAECMHCARVARVFYLRFAGRLSLALAVSPRSRSRWQSDADVWPCLSLSDYSDHLCVMCDVRDHTGTEHGDWQWELIQEHVQTSRVVLATFQYSVVSIVAVASFRLSSPNCLHAHQHWSKDVKGKGWSSAHAHCHCHTL